MTEKMREGFYIGPVTSLNGRRALVRTDVEGLPDGAVMAQFNDPVSASDLGGTPLNFGWHRFKSCDFDLDLEFENVDLKDLVR